MPPSCRKGGMMADPPSTEADPASLFLGGITASGKFDRDLWSLATDYGWQLFQISSSVQPKPRWKGSFSRINDSHVVLFGGSDENEYFNDVWILDQGNNGASWKEVKTKGVKPERRRAHTGVVAGSRHLIIFGGKSGETKLPLKDLWLLNLETWAWHDMSHLRFPGAARKGHTAVMLVDDMYVFGGRSSDTEYYDQLFALKFDAQSWMPTGWHEVIVKEGKRPALRNHHVGASLNGNRMLIYGGRGGHDATFPLLNDVWIFDASTSRWTEVKPLPDPNIPPMVAHPKPRIESASASLSGNSVIIAGGRDFQGRVLNDAWYLEFSQDNEKGMWRSVSPLDCSVEPIVSPTVTYVSIGFFIGICILLVAFLVVRYRTRVRQAPYEPIGGGSKRSAIGAMT